MAPRDRSRRQNHENHLWLFIMLTQLWQQVDRMPFKPPVTLGVSALCLVAHLQPAAVSMLALDASERAICLAPAPILAGHSDALLRLVGSAFVHGSDSHVYYNIASFIFKGVQLEQAMGPKGYAILLGAMLILSHSLVVLAAYLATFVGYDGWYHSCAIGFSAVIFSLKYILTHQHGGEGAVWGVRMPNQWVTWAELVLIQIISPHASFLGHLAGIGAGAMYIYLWPAARLMLAQQQQAGGAASWGGRGAGGRGARQTRYTYAAGSSGTSEDADIAEALRRSRRDAGMPEASGGGFRFQDEID
eukprot:CAMPEP_0205929322 /NCGR_PEP_ID=MMETSP1325-20131115/25244_1 /ASSEMBLY_ACC=CAM_ASM_000708 /TAXON_ID=236786 /ORGANISM="Florenciella sp., Strain RCC1007" /LENGTH=302 /DNA_ID=CAMNT_0053298521 /DNA_START=27 /DNA_END=935 /DNA_ORIENTATION=-